MQARQPSPAGDVLRPFLLVALLAFTVGFAGYLALVRPVAAQEPRAGAVTPAPDRGDPGRLI